MNTVSKFKETKVVTASAIFMAVLGAIFYCYEYYLRVAPSVMTSELMRSFAISNLSLGALVAYYYLAYVPAQIPVGIMMDRWGPRRVLTGACFGCAIGTFFFISDSLILAKLGRFIVGFGSAFAYVGVLKIASVWLPKKYFALVAGICSALGMFGAISGGVFVNLFVRSYGWRDTLFYSAIVGILLAVILWMFIKDKKESDNNKSDQEHKFTEATKKSSVLFQLKEVSKIKIVWLAGIIGSLTFLPLSAFAEMWAVPYLVSTGLTKSDAAFGSSLVFLGFAIGGPFWGWFSDFIKSRKKPLIIGGLVASICSFIFVLTPSLPTFVLYLLLFLCGLFTSAEILVFALGNDECDVKLSATTAAFINMLIMCGGIVLQPLVGLILDSISKGPIASFEDYRIALLALPVGLLFSVWLSSSIKETYSS